jgi:colanic acid biosynthesis protein WcaH
MLLNLTPLLSIDFILVKEIDNKLHVLVGKRVNEPAKDMWFVPGGRILKNETWKNAIERISLNELGYKLTYKNTKFIGFFDHIYTTNFANIPDVNTHYLCIGLKISLNDINIDLYIFSKQHIDIQWIEISELLNSDYVHQNTKNYFLPDDMFPQTLNW